MWEKLTDTATDTSSHRLKVPGGWIVRTVVKTNDSAGAGCAVVQTFVSDPNYDWESETEDL